MRQWNLGLDRFPRVALALQPTRLERLERLSRTLAGPDIWIKREDCTGLGLGGNKARKLEYLVAEALSLGADTLITSGGPQSNHARATAAAAARCGLRCVLVLVDSITGRDARYYRGGNLLLDRVFGAEIRIRPSRTVPVTALEAEAEQCRANGGKPYVIPIGGSNPTGILGIVRMTMELLSQAAAGGLSFSHIAVASESGGTQAGLAIGLAAAGLRAPVIGYCIGQTAVEQRGEVDLLIRLTCAKLGIASPISSDDLVFAEGVLGTGYGQPTAEMLTAVTLMGAQEGIALDPVYTGKAMVELIAAIKNGEFTREDRVLFMHTGGAPALFAYPEVFEEETPYAAASVNRRL